MNFLFTTFYSQKLTPKVVLMLWNFHNPYNKVICIKYSIQNLSPSLANVFVLKMLAITPSAYIVYSNALQDILLWKQIL